MRLVEGRPLAAGNNLKIFTGGARRMRKRKCVRAGRLLIGVKPYYRCGSTPGHAVATIIEKLPDKLISTRERRQ